MDAVTADLNQFMRQVSEVTDRVVTIDSAGGNVRISGRQRQVSEVTIDPQWANRARASEVEGELQDALSRFANESSPGELTQGPRSPALDELMHLVANPEAMMRRIKQARR